MESETAPPRCVDEALQLRSGVGPRQELIEIVESVMTRGPKREVHEDPALDEEVVVEGGVAHEERREIFPAASEGRAFVLRDAGDPEEEQVSEAAAEVADALRSRNDLGQKAVGLLGGAELLQGEGGGTHAAGEVACQSALCFAIAHVESRRGPQILPRRGHRNAGPRPGPMSTSHPATSLRMAWPGGYP